MMDILLVVAFVVATVAANVWFYRIGKLDGEVEAWAEFHMMLGEAISETRKEESVDERI